MQGWRARGLLCVQTVGLLAFSAWAAGCGGSSGGGAVPVGGPQVSGRVVAGPVAGAMVRVYRIEPDRSLVLIAEGTTSPTGDYDLTPPGSGPFLVLAGGGSYKDEATGQTIALGPLPNPATLDSPRAGVLEALIGSGVGTSPIPVSITPLSTISARRTATLSASDPGALDEAAVLQAATTIAAEMGLGAVDPRSISPVDLTDSSQAGVDPNSLAARMGALLAGLSQAARTAGVSDPMALIDALAADFSDGLFNGQDGSGPVPLGGGTLSPGAGTTDLATATQTFLDDPALNQSGTTSTSFQTLLQDVATQDVAPPGVNKAPTLDAVADRAAAAGDPPLTITLTGVGPGVGESQAVTVDAVSSAPAQATVQVTGGGTSWSLSVTPLAQGTVTITVTVRDDGGTANGGVDATTRSFDVTIGPAVTAPPAITSAAPGAAAVEGLPYSHAVTTTGVPAPALSAAGLPPWLTLTGATLQGTPGAGDVGVVSSVTLTADNGVGTPATQSFTVTVFAAVPPAITSSPGLTATQGALYTFTAVATGTPPPTFSASGLPGWLTLSGSTLSGTPGPGDLGATGTITITASNGVLPPAAQSFTIDVQGPPVITSSPPAVASVGQAYAYTVTASGNPAPALSASGLPAWLSFAGGALTGTPGAGDQGPTGTITVTADNGVGVPAVQTFSIDVRSPPAITSPAPPATAAAGAAYSHAVTATGNPAPTLSLSGAPAWLTLSGSTLSGTPGPADQGLTGTITITADNGATPAATQDFTIDVQAPPAITSAAPTSATAGQLYSYTVAASGHPAPTFSASGLPAWLVFDGVDTLSGTPGALDQGSHGPITLTAQNGVAPDDAQTFSLEVFVAPAITSTPPATGQVGIAYVYTLTTTGHPAPTLQVTGAPAWLTLSGAVLSGTPGPADVGLTGTITVTAQNGVLPDASQPFTIDVRSHPSITSSPPIVASAGQLYSYTLVAIGTPAPTFNASGLPGWLSLVGDTITGTPGPADAGPTGLITVTADNGVAPDATQTFSVEVSVPPEITSLPPPATIQVGGAYSHTVTTSGHPAPALTLSGAPAWLTLTGDLLAGTPGPGDSGLTGTITLTAQSGVLPDASQQFTIDVQAPPSLTSTPPATAVAGQPFSYTCAATGHPAPTFSVSGLPAWLTFDGTATISGVPALSDQGLNGPITITAVNGVLPDDAQTFSIDVLLPPPITITRLVPDRGPVAGGTALTIEGDVFVPGCVVRVGGAPATDVVVVSATLITCVTPAGGLGAADVEVEAPGGDKAFALGGFAYEGLTPEVLLPHPAEGEHEYTQWTPSVGISGGRVVVAWADARNAAGVQTCDIYYRTSADGGATWSPDARLNSNDGVKLKQGPSVGVSGDRVVVAWPESRLGGPDVFYRTSSDGGATWSPDSRLDTTAGVPPHVASVAVSGDRVVVAWAGTPAGSWTVFVRTSDDGGTTWSPDAPLSTGLSQPASGSVPSVSVSGDRLVVAWTDTRNGGFDIYYRTSADGGATWSTEAALNDVVGAADFTDASVGVSGDRLVGTWADTRDGGGDVYCRTSGDGGTSWSSATRLNSVQGGARRPSAAVSGLRVVAAWFGAGVVQFSASADGGASWSADAALTPASNPNERPAVGVSTDAVVLGWTDDRDGSADVFARTSLDAGASWSADVRMNSPLERATHFEPVVARTGSGRALVVVKESTQVCDIVARASDDHGATWQASARLNTDPAGENNQHLPAIAVSDERVVVVWRDSRFGTGIFYRTSDDGGATWSLADQKLNLHAGVPEAPSIAMSGDKVFVAWVKPGVPGVSEPAIYYRTSEDGGVTWSPDEYPVSDAAGVAPQGRPSVGMSGNRIVVAWQDRRAGNDDVYYRVSHDAGANWSPDARLNTDAGTTGQLQPEVAVSGQHVVVAWQDGRDGAGQQDWSLYSRTSSDGGVTWSADARLNGLARLYTYTPGDFVEIWGDVVALGQRVVVVWSDLRNGAGDPDVFYRVSDDGGSTWSSDARVHSDTTTAGQSAPSVALGAGGYVLFAWRDERDDFFRTAFRRAFVPYSVAPTITSAPPSTAEVGVPYSYTVGTSGSPVPTVQVSGAPAWLTLSGETLSGTPGVGDMGLTATITVTAHNGASPDASQDFVIDVLGPPAITSAPLPDATAGQPYSYAVTASGNPAPTLSVGPLPGWLSFDAGTGTLSGTPAPVDQGTSAAITITADNGLAPDATQVFSIEVGVPPALVSAPPAAVQVGALYTYSITATGYPAPTLAVSGAPAWLTLSGSTLSGTPGPADAGPTGLITVSAQNGVVPAASQQFTIDVLAPPSFSSAPITSATAGQPYSYVLAASGNPLPTFSVGALPGWLSFDGLDTLSGTPAPADQGTTGPITVTAGNGVGPGDVQTFSVQVGVPPTITSTPPATVVVGAAYTHTVTATGSPPPTLSLSGAPAWLTLSGDTLSGTPGPGDQGLIGPITLTASNGFAPEASLDFTIDVQGPPTVTSAAPTVATVSQLYSYTVVASGNPAPSFSVSGLPAWLSFDPGTRTLSGVPGAGDEGPTGPITVTVTNALGSDDQVFQVTVGSAFPGGLWGQSTWDGATWGN